SPGGRAVLIVGAMLALALVIVCYRRTTEGLTLRSRILLAGSRLVALLVLLVMLSGAICAIDLATDDRPHVLIVLDDSASMTLQNRLADAEAAADALRRRWADDYTINIVRTSVLGRDAASQRPIAQAIVAASAQTPRP